MALTVAQVVGLPELGMAVRTTGVPLDREVRWVAVSEHLDPTPWLEGGDLLLTTGMAIDGDEQQIRTYVERLVAAQVAGLGFGVGLTHQVIPEALIESAERVDLPVLEVPQPVPFVAVSKAVSRLLTTEEYAESAASFESQRRLIRAALSTSAGGGEEVVAVLARHVGGFCLHLDHAGHVRSARPAAAAERAAELAPEIERLRPRGVLASSSLSSAQEQVVIVPIGVKGAAEGFLVVGSPRHLRPADQAVMNVAVSLLSWSASRPAASGSGMDRWRRLLVERALEAGLDEQLLAELGLAGLDPGRAVGLAWRGVSGGPIGDDVLATINAVPGVIACRLPSGVVAGLGPSDDGPSTELSATAASPGIAALGVSCPLDLREAANVRQALDQAERASALGGGLQVFDEEPTRGLTSLIDASTTAAWAQGYLGALTSTAEGPELMDTLRAWLGEHGQVDAAAQRLGIHRHTVRHRVRRAEAVLERSLDDPTVRADLWFALSAVQDG